MLRPRVLHAAPLVIAAGVDLHGAANLSSDNVTDSKYHGFYPNLSDVSDKTQNRCAFCGLAFAADDLEKHIRMLHGKFDQISTDVKYSLTDCVCAF